MILMTMMIGIDVKMVLPMNLVIASIHVVEIHHALSNVVMITRPALKTALAWKVVPMDVHVITGIAM